MVSRQDLKGIPPPFTRGCIYSLLFKDHVADLGAKRRLALYHFMHETVQEVLAACHLAVLPNPKSYDDVWRKWFGRPEMAEMWKFYSGITELRFLDITSIVSLADEADKVIHTLLVVSLFEAGNASLVTFLANWWLICTHPTRLLPMHLLCRITHLFRGWVLICGEPLCRSTCS